MLRTKQQGFTLTEVMIVVAVLAILAAIAVPSFSHFTKKAQLRKAKAALLENAHALEQIYSKNKKFADGCPTPPSSGNCSTPLLPDDSGTVGTDGGERLFGKVPGDKFKITTTYTAADKYEMKAEPNGAWANREKRELTLDNTGHLVCYDTKTQAVCKNF